VSDGFNLAAHGLPETGIALIGPGSEIRASLAMAVGETPARRDGGDA
jgi:aldose 1-epimerase